MAEIEDPTKTHSHPILRGPFANSPNPRFAFDNEFERRQKAHTFRRNQTIDWPSQEEQDEVACSPAGSRETKNETPAYSVFNASSHERFSPATKIHYQRLASSASYCMYRSHNVGSFIATISLPFAAYDALLPEFSKHYIVHSRPRRPLRFVTKHAALASWMSPPTNLLNSKMETGALKSRNFT